MPAMRYQMEKSGSQVNDEVVAIEDTGAASEVGLFGTLVEMTQIPGFGLHKAEQLLVGSPLRLELRNQGVASEFRLGMAAGTDQFIATAGTDPTRA